MHPSFSLANIHNLVRYTDCIKGTDQSQGRGQVLSNINACLAVQSTIKGTLGPYGGDLLMVDENGRQTITNDGATVMKVGHAPLQLAGVVADPLTASGHRTPRSPNPHRHCALARRRSRRRNNIGRRISWGGIEGDQRTCRAGCEQPDHHQGSAESFQHGRKQDHGNRRGYCGGQPARNTTEARRNCYEQQTHPPKFCVLHENGR